MTRRGRLTAVKKKRKTSMKEREVSKLRSVDFEEMNKHVHVLYSRKRGRYARGDRGVDSDPVSSMPEACPNTVVGLMIKDKVFHAYGDLAMLGKNVVINRGSCVVTDPATGQLQAVIIQPSTSGLSCVVWRHARGHTRLVAKGAGLVLRLICEQQAPRWPGLAPATSNTG